MAAGDAVEVTARPAHGITVPQVFRALTGDVEAAEHVLDAGVLGEDDSAYLAGRLARRRADIDQ